MKIFGLDVYNMLEILDIIIYIIHLNKCKRKRKSQTEWIKRPNISPRKLGLRNRNPQVRLSVGHAYQPIRFKWA